MFVDASAIVAILTGEAGYERLADRIIRCEVPMTSAIAIYEAVLAIGHKTGSPQRAEKAVVDFLRLSSIEIVALAEPEARAALDAFARFGKGQGHPAQLNMGDCFS